MMRAIGTTCALGLLLALPSAALGKTTANQTFKSDGSAAAPGAVVGLNEAGTYEDFPVTVAADDADGQMSVEIHWGNPGDDWDLYVYRKNSSGGLDQVGSSAGGPPSTSEATTVSQQGSDPLPPGAYVVRAQNYAATSPDFAGSVKFTEFKVPNKRPTAKLKAPKTSVAGRSVKLDASGSKDPDGTIDHYRWDLDGDGAMEVDGGTTPTLTRKLKAGVYHVAVQVTDNDGRRAYATRTIKVFKKR